MEQWQFEALQQLLSIEVHEVETGSRVYISSETYGTSRYHLVDRRFDGVQIEQIEVDEKWSKRVNLRDDEVPALLKTLLSWYLEDVRRKAEAEASGDNDAHPF
jgi:hypothetical protein